MNLSGRLKERTGAAGYYFEVSAFDSVPNRILSLFLCSAQIILGEVFYVLYVSKNH